MITEPTVFILGAGASCPYGYPSGTKLREQILSSFVQDSLTYFENESRGPIGPLQAQAEEFVEKFRKSTNMSIDLFLARNPEFMKIGKWAIIFRILIAEANSRFREEMDKRDQDWYSNLFTKLTDDLVKKDSYSRFCQNDVSFITFNYDRSLEYFLHESLANSFHNVGAGKIIEQMNKLRVIHVFGQVAGLDWQDLKSRIKYGCNISVIDPGALAENLKIIYEEQENPQLAKAHEQIRKAKNIFFLGFGYAKENLKILNIPTVLRQDHRIYGTALNCVPKEIADIKSHLGISWDGKVLHHDVQIQNCDCLRLLRDFL